MRLFLKSKYKKFQDFFARSEKSYLSVRMMAHTVQLLTCRHDVYRPIQLFY